MGKFRKKPIVIEARQIGNGAHSDIDIAKWCGGDLTLKTSDDRKGLVPTISITTLEGVMASSVGDWVIQGVSGEFYPCKPDIFAASYEPADSKADRLVLPDLMVAVDRKDVRAAAALIRDHAGSDVQTQELVWRLFDAVKKDLR